MLDGKLESKSNALITRSVSQVGLEELDGAELAREELLEFHVEDGLVASLHCVIGPGLSCDGSRGVLLDAFNDRSGVIVAVQLSHADVGSRLVWQRITAKMRGCEYLITLAQIAADGLQ